MFIFLILFIVAIIAEIIDSSLGMMYGTLLSPLLMYFGGFDPLVIIPAILISQAAGGFVASLRHHYLNNANFGMNVKLGWCADLKYVYLIVLPGIFGVFLGAYFSTIIPKNYLKLYIAILVIVASIFVLANLKFKFTWKKVGIIGLISAFNKALSGGGFGPFVTSGQLVVGQDGKKSVAITTLSEVPICLMSFFSYFLLTHYIDWKITISLIIGSVIGSLIGPKITKIIKDNYLKLFAGILALISGILLLIEIIFQVKIGG